MDAAELKQKADHCRRLADLLPSYDPAYTALLNLAQEYEMTAEGQESIDRHYPRERH